MLAVPAAQVPPSALHIFNNSRRPFTALGLERLSHARSLNSVNKRELLKRYRKLALELHPDRCAHGLALEAMQVLNACYEQVLARGK